MPTTNQPTTPVRIDRRGFIAAGAAAAAAFTILPASTVRSAEANSKIQLGLIGCGGRGKWIAKLFPQHAPCEFVAVHDYFQDRADDVGEMLHVPAERRFTGLDGYLKLLDQKLDGVVIISPPYFHPEQVVAALDRGRHVYLAKPIAVDVPGALAITSAAKKAQGKLSVLVDFQTRTTDFYQQAIQKVHEGIIGKPVCGQSYYHSGRLGKQANGDSPMARLRNWVFDTALSGDIIVEQNIHVLDVANWAIGAHPVKAVGTGGRRVRTDVGDCWDHYVVTYTYPNDVLIDFSSTQFLYGFDDLCTRIFCETGTLDTHYGGMVNIRGKSGGYRGGITQNIYEKGAVANIQNWVASIQNNKPLNNAQESADSTLTCILGRTATRANRPVTWDEMLQANEKIDAKLTLPKDGPTWRS